MVSGRNRFWWRHKWHIIVLYTVILLLMIVLIFSKAFQGTIAELVFELVWLLVALGLLVTTSLILSRLSKLCQLNVGNSSSLEKIIGSLEKNRSTLGQINQNTRLSESAKTIASRDADRQALRETVFERLHRQDFYTTYEIIDEIGKYPDYKDFAKQLRSEADNFHNANDIEKVNQVIEHIDKLLDNYQWSKARKQIESLLRDKPGIERVKQLRQRMVDKKQERKKILLNAWDGAVKRQATNRGIEILRELDSYLTPNEALALQEAARDVFRNKLHNLGVQFALAVSGKDWEKAIGTGREIIHKFPNSKMATEIHGKMDILKQNKREKGQ
ncbi:MAG: hypothetical protein ACYST9_06450 [Planctomycetota bacterium]